MSSDLFILAQDDTSHFAQIVEISFILIALIVAGCVAVMLVKRRLRQSDDLSGLIGFTLADLREMRKSGQISDEEFERAKGKLVENSRRAAEKELSRQSGGDLNVARQRAAESSRQDSTDDPGESDGR